MTSLSSVRGAARPLLLLGVAVLAGLLAFTFLRRQAADETPGGRADGLTYEQRVAPLVAESERVVAELQSTNAASTGLKLGTELRGRWEEARTAAGYDRLRHDGFILTFNQFFNILQSVELIASVLEEPPAANGAIPDRRRMEAQFALQSIHGAETGAQLVSKTGLSVEALLSRTNLVRELTAGVQAAATQQVKARQVFEQLK